MTASDQPTPSTTPPADTAPQPVQPIQPVAPPRGWFQRARAAIGTIRGVWIFIAVASVVLLARGLLTPATPAAPTPTVVAGHTATALPAAPLVGHLAPGVTLLDLNGNQV